MLVPSGSIGAVQLVAPTLTTSTSSVRVPEGGASAVIRSDSVCAALRIDTLTLPSPPFSAGWQSVIYREAVDFYQYCQLDVQEGGDHSYQNLQSRLADIVNFGQLA